MAQPVPEIKAIINVDENGNATVKISFKVTGRSSMYFTLPRFENYTICEAYGSYYITNSPSSAYFYYNSSITLIPGENGTSILSLCYNFPYASLLAGKQGWFMTPMLVASPPIPVEVFVRIPGLEKVSLESPTSTGIDKNGYRMYVVKPNSPSLIPGRVVIEYTTIIPISPVNYTRNIGNTSLIIESPPYYKKLSERVLEVSSRAYQNLTTLIGVSLPSIIFEFYLPKQSLGGISTLGFIMGEDVNAGGKGPIMLNLGLIRYAPGYLETTVIHEMVHAFLGKAGVEANDETRWFHEGLAQYLSLNIAEGLGYNVSDLRAELLNASESLYSYTGGNFSFIQHWPQDPEMVGDAYLASFFIINNLTSTFGGKVYLEKVFTALKNYGKVTSNDDIVYVLSTAAGKNLAPLFRGWGFRNIRDWQAPASTSPPLIGKGNNFTLLILVIGLAIGVLIYFLQQRVQRGIEAAKSESVFHG
ncbi:MAG: hypothetical protein ABWK01_08850 [Infirmifilum sp.]